MGVHKNPKAKTGTEGNCSGNAVSYQNLLAGRAFIEATWKHAVDLYRNVPP